MANRVRIDVSTDGKTIEISDNEDRDVVHIEYPIDANEHAAVLLAIAENSEKGNDILSQAIDMNEQTEDLLNHLYINGSNVSVGDFREGWIKV